MNANDLRICFVGDSYVNGTGDPDCLGWAGRVSAAARRTGHDLTYYNLGVRRETSVDIARRWLAECERRLPTTTQNHVVFSFGANDVALDNGARRVPEDTTLDNLRTILNAARIRYRTLMIGPPAAPDETHNARLARLSERMSEAAAEVSVPYLALFLQTVNDASWMEEVRNNDGAHPRAAGYARIAELVETWPAWWFR
jgi:lysophospholipase L1-like esterase